MSNERMDRRAMPQSPEVETGIVLIAIACAVAFVALTMAGLFLYLRNAAPGATTKTAERSFSQPTLQTDPQSDLVEFERNQRRELSTYGWIDRSRGLAQISIEDAMKVIARRGDHAYDPLDGPSALSPDDTTKGQP